jgi:hypothetical protein
MNIVRLMVFFVLGLLGGRRGAEKRDELPPPNHSITSSARSKIAVGTSMPSALAVFRSYAVSWMSLSTRMVTRTPAASL